MQAPNATPTQKPKVWGIGLSRTGTLSLHAALQALGYRSLHYPLKEAMFEGDFSHLAACDAASDIPVARWFREIDEAFPGSRFVLTTRDIEQWVAGLSRHLDAKSAATRPEPWLRMRQEMYGSVHPDAASLRRTYYEHEQAVLTYFADRLDDLLVLRICDGEGWERLCPFLGVEIPETDFPHEHLVTAPRPREEHVVPIRTSA